jgi:hypothetical protein
VECIKRNSKQAYLLNLRKAVDLIRAEFLKRDKSKNNVSGVSTLELDDDVENLHNLANQVSNAINSFEQRRYSEKNFKVFTN